MNLLKKEKFKKENNLMSQEYKKSQNKINMKNMKEIKTINQKLKTILNKMEINQKCLNQEEIKRLKD